jgi:wobble nucleotide-excising tRNase
VIDKIIKLEGVGMLHESVPGDPLTLTKRVAIYADNGRGKSTFASLLRSLQDNDCAEVKARRSLRDVDGQRVELQIGEATYTYAEGAWDQTYDGLHVFDDYFVEANVSAGSIIWAAQLEHLFKLALRQARAHPSDDIEDTLADCVDGVNSRLRALRAEFDIATLVQVDTAETPRVDYTLRVMGNELPLVTADPASPSFSTVLGESDRRLLALAFFFYGLDSDPDLSGKTVVLDDPSRGLDRRHKTRVADAILGFLERGQLIVLSADAEFVKMLRDRGFDQVLQLSRAGIYCTFEECNIDAVLARDYVEETAEPEGWQSGGHPWF